MLKEIMAITRADHGIMLSLAVAISLFYLNYFPPYGLELLLTPFLISSAVFVCNDLMDIKTDKANARTDRPLATGKFSPQMAIFLFIVLIVASLYVILRLPFKIAVIAFSALVISILYNWKVKGLPILGNVIVAGMMALPFFYAQLAADQGNEILTLFGMAVFFYGLARELVKTIEDREGDLQQGYKTAAVVFGVENTRKVAIAFYLIFLLLLVLLAARKWIFILPAAYNFGNLRLVMSVSSATARGVRKEMLKTVILGLTTLMLASFF